MRDEVVAKRAGQRRDDVEFTFEKGRWGHLGEATLANRVRSHPDVGERWYPEILDAIRRKQGRVTEEKEEGEREAEKVEHGKVEEAEGDSAGLDTEMKGATVQVH